MFSDRLWPRAPLLAGAYRPWLTDRGSLTRRIQTRCTDFRVEVVFQGLRAPVRDEAMLASIRDQNLATFTGEGKIDLTKPIWSQMC